MLPGIFLGYEQQAGGGWSGDLWIVDQEEISKAEHSYEVYPKRLKAAEAEPVLKDNDSVFPHQALQSHGALESVIEESAKDCLWVTKCHQAVLTQSLKKWKRKTKINLCQQVTLSRTKFPVHR